MVATMSSTKPPPNSKVIQAAAPTKPKRAPLSPSRNDNNAPPPPLPRGPISKNVIASRYLSATPSSNFDTKRMTSSSSSSSSTTTSSSSNSVYTPKKRDQSVERRYSGNNVMKSSIRSLSVSFQGESFALPVSKVSNPTNNNVSRGTYERKKARGTPTRSSTRSKNKESFMTMSVDFDSEKMKMRTSNAMKELRKSLNADIECDSDNSDHGISDNVRVGGRRAIVVPARFWQDTINLLKRVQTDPVSVSSQPLLRNSTKVMSGFKALDNGPKISKTRNGVVGCANNLGNKPSILSFPTTVDARRGKVAEKKLDDAHVLRMLHNKHLQWRFANARADAAMAAQQAATQKRLYNAWVTISKMWNSVISKRTAIQHMKMNSKLHSVLKKQILYLDNWDLNEGDHSISLAGVIMALESSSLCLPVQSGAKADIPNLKHAICSAIDVMEAMAVSVSIHSLITKVEHVNSLASELASAMKTECSLLEQCKDLFSDLTLLEMQDCSIRAHTLQLIPSSPMTQYW